VTFLAALLILSVAMQPNITQPKMNITLLYKGQPAYMLAPCKIEFLVLYNGNFSRPVEKANITLVKESGERMDLQTDRNGYASTRLMPLLPTNEHLTVSAVSPDGLKVQRETTINVGYMTLPVYIATAIAVAYSIKLMIRWIR